MRERIDIKWPEWLSAPQRAQQNRRGGAPQDRFDQEISARYFNSIGSWGSVNRRQF